MSESTLVKACIEYLLYRGHFVWRNNSGMIMNKYINRAGEMKQSALRAGLRGSSDIIGVATGGRFIAVECKVAPNKLSEAQEVFLEKVRNLKGFAVVAYTIEDLQKAGL